MADDADWNRNRATVLPLTIPISFCYLQKLIIFKDVSEPKIEGKPETAPQFIPLCICAGLALPGLIMACYIRLRTTYTRPPPVIMTVYAVLGFVQAICWISFTSDVVINILEVLGCIFKIPASVLGLTILAWGNCLGDMSADVAMTK